MAVPLRVGVVGLSHRWQALLDQTGVFYQAVEPDAIGELSETGPVLVLGDGVNATAPLRQTLHKHLRAGGALLLEAPLAAALFSFTTHTRTVRALFTPPEDPFFPLPFAPVEASLIVLEQANRVRCECGRPTVAEFPYGGGRLVVLPGGLMDRLAEYRVARRKFFVAGRERLPTERICRVARQGIRFLLEKGLQRLFHHLGLPFVVRWPFPQGADGVFLFRVDTDFAHPAQMEALYRVCHEAKLPATWFVETASARQYVTFFGDMEGQEIGLHGYRHRIFQTVEENLADIERGLAVLETIGLHPTSYAAPYGEWNPALHRALVRSGFALSSEFALAYDDRPFALPSCRDGHPFWQVPIHPISVRRLRLADFSETAMVTYYLKKLHQLAAYRQPVIFYHHPGHGCLNVFRDLFAEVQRLGWPRLSFGQFARWWATSRKASIHLHFQEGKLAVTGYSGEKELVLGVNWPETHSTGPEVWQVLSVQKGTSRRWQPPPADPPPTTAAEVRHLLKKDWRMLLNDWESYRGKRKQ